MAADLDMRTKELKQAQSSYNKSVRGALVHMYALDASSAVVCACTSLQKCIASMRLCSLILTTWDNKLMVLRHACSQWT